MNYGKEQTLRKQKKLSNKRFRIGRKLLTLIYQLAFVAACALLTCGIGAAYGIYQGILDSAPDIREIDATPTGYLSTVLDADENVTATLVASGSNRIYVTIDEIPINLQNAFIAIEDSRFREHNGIDLQGILRAAVVGLSSGNFSEGASTITQQLLKNNVFTGWTDEDSFSDKLKRKIQEQYLAVQLERVQSKDWILENYLNTVNLGQNTLGVQSASMRYFNKDVSGLTLSECAVIAGITKYPSAYNPITNPKDNAKRREKVLNDMLAQGLITAEQHNVAMADDVYSRIQKVNSDIQNDAATVNSYFVDALTEQVIDDLMSQKGYTETEAYKALYNGGLTIYSTQDSGIQQICENEVNDLNNYPTNPKTSFSYTLTVQKADGSFAYYDEQTMLSYYRSSNADYSMNFASESEASQAIEQYKQDILEEGDSVPENGETFFYTVQPQAALTVIEPSTGEVKAIVGGRGEKTANRTWNRATDSMRQPGSTFKILAAFAPALDTNQMTLASVKNDAPYKYSNGTKLKNYDNRYRGFTTIREAITYSNNIVTVKTLKQIGIDTAFDYLVNRFGFTTLTDQDRYEPLALGGITNGVTNLELTAAYAAIANKGTYIKPRLYTKILDHEGKVLLDNQPQETEAVKETTAWLLTDAMKDVLTEGTGKEAYFDTMPAAGKSGTTNNGKDTLFAGFSPYYACVVWGGYDDNTSQEDWTTSYSKLIWRSVMSKIHTNLPQKDFEMPDGIVTEDVCKKSGRLAIEDVCTNDPRGNMAIAEYFADGTQPVKECNHHISSSICPVSKMPAGPYCPAHIAGVQIVGGSDKTEDAPYLYKGENQEICNVHKAPAPPPTPQPDTAVDDSTADDTVADDATDDTPDDTADDTAGDVADDTTNNTGTVNPEPQASEAEATETENNP